MAKKKRETITLPREPKRQAGYFVLYFGGKCVGNRLTLEEFLPKYFINLEKNLTKDSNLEELLTKYEKIWNAKGKVNYVDSWGHIWNQGPSKSKLLNYLSEKYNELGYENTN